MSIIYFISLTHNLVLYASSNFHIVKLSLHKQVCIDKFFLDKSPCWKASMSTFEQRDLSRRILSHFVVNMSKKTCLCKLVLYYTLYQTFVYRILFKAEEWEIVSQILLRRVVESDRIRLLLFHSKYRGHSSLNKVPKWQCIKVV